jgi:hypothetical protein
MSQPKAYQYVRIGPRVCTLRRARATRDDTQGFKPVRETAAMQQESDTARDNGLRRQRGVRR